MFSTIRTAIIDKLNSEDITKIQVAYRTDRATLDGFPAAVVSPSENEADYASTANDRRVYAFKIRVYYPFTTETEQDDADMALEEALDEMLDAFNTRGALGTACEWVEPIPSVWQYEERGDSTYRVAELTLRCIKYQPITS
jgi:uncharacterized protein (DUF2336 family)